MNTNLLTIAAQLSDEALLAKVKTLAQGSRQVTVELIAHLAELHRRKLYRGEGPGKLFVYCTDVLRFSEAAAWNRVKAACGAQFPGHPGPARGWLGEPDDNSSPVATPDGGEPHGTTRRGDGNDETTGRQDCCPAGAEA